MENNKFRSEKLPSTPIETDVEPGKPIPVGDLARAFAKHLGITPEEAETMFTTGKPIVKDDGAE